MRDLHGYGRRRPLAQWPGAARIAVNFVLNYEEGGERNILDGDAQAETYLVPEVVGLPPIAARNSIVEDLFEYGSRAGFWRLLGLFEERALPFTCWAAQNHRKCTAVFLQDAQSFSSKVHTHFHESAHSGSGSADAREG